MANYLIDSTFVDTREKQKIIVPMWQLSYHILVGSDFVQISNVFLENLLDEALELQFLFQLLDFLLLLLSVLLIIYDQLKHFNLNNMQKQNWIYLTI